MPKSRRMKTMRRKRSTRRRSIRKRMRHQRRTVGSGCSWYDRQCKKRESNIQSEIVDLNSKLLLDKEYLQKTFDEGSPDTRNLLLKRQYNDALIRETRRDALQRMGYKLLSTKGSTPPPTVYDEEQSQRYEAYEKSKQSMEERERRNRENGTRM